MVLLASICQPCVLASITPGHHGAAAPPPSPRRWSDAKGWAGAAGGCGDTGTSRRQLLLLATLLLAAPDAAIAKQPPVVEEPAAPRFRKTPSGVKIQDILEGAGPEANAGDLLEFNYVLRRANGYYVFSTIDQFNGSSEPVVLPLSQGKIIPGLEEVLLGMKPGGKRRALVPPNVGYTDVSLEPQPQDFGPRRSLFSHAKEPLVFEVQLIRIK